MSNHGLSREDALAIVELLGEVCVLQGDHTAKKRLLLEGICRLTRGDAWVWGLFVQLEAGGFPSYILHLHGGFTEEHLAAYLRAMEHPGNARFTAPFARLVEEKRGHVTRFRQQHGMEEAYQGSDVQAAWQRAGIEPGILSCRPLDARTLSTVAIYRRPGAEAFTERESRIAHILLSEVPWLHSQGWDLPEVAAIPDLSPRRCTIMNFLVQGATREQIAEKLRLSPHTVADYVKEIYRHFGVHSQPELIAHFQNGDGGDA